MKMLDDIWASISGNAKTKIDDPFIGAFIGSWIVCNWSGLATLIWGEGSASERIAFFHDYLTKSPWLALNSIVVLPVVFAAFYLFVFPWVSLFFKHLQKTVNDRLHQQAVDVELEKVKQQEDLNKARLRSNPDKQFLEQIVQYDIDKSKEELELLKLQTVLTQKNAEEATANALTATSKASIIKLEEESKQRQADLEREKFNVATAKLRSTLASQQFPSAYAFMLLVEQSLNEDGIRISLDANGQIVATIFGYDNFLELLEDEKFNNKTLSEVVYVFYEPEELAQNLEKVVVSEQSENPDFTTELLFDHLQSIFDKLPCRLLRKSDLGDVWEEFFEEHRYSILQMEELSGTIAESDTIFDEVEFEGVSNIESDGDISAEIDMSASGSHRRDHEVPGQGMSISMRVVSTPQVGTKAFGAFEIISVDSSLDQFD